MKIPQLPAKAAPGECALALEEAGCLVVTDLLTADARRSVRAELDPQMAKARVIDKDDPTQFYPGRTRRTSGLVTHSESVGWLSSSTTSNMICLFPTILLHAL